MARGGAHEADLLHRAYESSLEVAQENRCESVAFPAISCGAYAYPLEQGAEIAISTVRDWIDSHETPKLVRFVLFAESTFAVFLDEAAKLLAVKAQ